MHFFYNVKRKSSSLFLIFVFPSVDQSRACCPARRYFCCLCPLCFVQNKSSSIFLFLSLSLSFLPPFTHSLFYPIMLICRCMFIFFFVFYSLSLRKKKSKKSKKLIFDSLKNSYYTILLFLCFFSTYFI